MPWTESLEILVRNGPLNEGDWLGLVAARRNLIVPHLDKFTLSELGELKCIRSEEGHYHEILRDNPKVRGDNRFSLKTQGIFQQAWKAIEQDPQDMVNIYPAGVVNLAGGTIVVWGLTRDGAWIVAHIAYVAELGYKSRLRHRAELIDIDKVDLLTLISLTREEPRKIWQLLGEAVKRWRENRKMLYEHARYIAGMVETEELVVDLISIR